MGWRDDGATRRGWRLALIALTASGCGGVAPAQHAAWPAPSPAVGPSTAYQLDWLVGSWVARDPDGGCVVERWLGADEGLLTAQGVRHSASGAPAGYALTRLQWTPGGPRLTVATDDGEVARLAVRAVGMDGFVAEGLGHEFPLRLQYRRLGPAAYGVRRSGVGGEVDLHFEREAADDLSRQVCEPPQADGSRAR